MNVHAKLCLFYRKTFLMACISFVFTSVVDIDTFHTASLNSLSGKVSKLCKQEHITERASVIYDCSKAVPRKKDMKRQRNVIENKWCPSTLPGNRKQLIPTVTEMYVYREKCGTKMISLCVFTKRRLRSTFKWTNIDTHIKNVHLSFLERGEMIKASFQN